MFIRKYLHEDDKIYPLNAYLKIALIIRLTSQVWYRVPYNFTKKVAYLSKHCK